jgi:hypothetical protein
VECGNNLAANYVVTAVWSGCRWLFDLLLIGLSVCQAGNNLAANYVATAVWSGSRWLLDLLLIGLSVCQAGRSRKGESGQDGYECGCGCGNVSHGWFP